MRKIILTVLKRFNYRLRKIDGDELIETPNLINDECKKVKLKKLTHEKNATFFGYHDKTPSSLDGEKILACSVSSDDTKLDNECTKMEVGFFNNSNGDTFQPVDETYTWCWQQGCMLQWNPLKPNRQIYYNSLVNSEHGSILYDINKNIEIKRFTFPIYSISSNGKYASSLNFTRLGLLRPGYGYKGNIKKNDLPNAPDDDGVFLIDLKTGNKKLIVSLKSIAANTDQDVPHYINHITFSPDSSKLTFFHIYENQSGERLIRFYLYDIKHDILKLLEAANNVSHYCWRNNNGILTSEMESGKIVTYMYNLEEERKIVIDIPHIGDYHPMFNPADSDIIVADTKPDEDRNQHLFLFNIKSGKYFYAGKFHLPDEYIGEVRCDLHPRWDRQGKNLIVDTAEGGKRSMVKIDVTEGVKSCLD